MSARQIAFSSLLALLCVRCASVPEAPPPERGPAAPPAEAPRAEPEPAPRIGSVIGSEFEYVVRAGDTLTAVGARYGVDARVLARMNQLPRPHRLQVGQRLRVANSHLVPEALAADGILINVPQRMLFLFREGELAAAYPVGLGRGDWQTPLGSYEIATRERDKAWIVPLSIQEEMKQRGKPVLTRVEPGPDNPLGGYWLGLDRDQFGIHGTLAPASVYAFRSHGCVRMHRDDIGELFDSVRVGEEVHIIYRPVMIAHSAGGDVLLEVHPDVYGRGDRPMSELAALVGEHGLEIDWARARRVIAEREGVPRSISGELAKAEEE